MRQSKKIRIVLSILLIVANLSGWALAETQSIQVAATGVSDFQNNQPIYMMLITVSEVNVSKYRIEREIPGKPESRTQLAELTYAKMQHAGFRYFDLAGLEKHGLYRYYISTLNAEGQTVETATANGVVENIRYKGNMQQFTPVFTQNNATFTLGPRVDPENEALEYRLYTRLPGGGGEKRVNVWKPTNDKERVIVNFPESCDWKLTCIETDQTIPDRAEVVLVNWSLFAVK
jgi:hypothetical protein